MFALYSMEIEGRPITPEDSVFVLSMNYVQPDNFAWPAFRWLRGRAFSPNPSLTDHLGSGEIIVTEVLARQFFPDARAVGGRMRRGWSWLPRPLVRLKARRHIVGRVPPFTSRLSAAVNRKSRRDSSDAALVQNVRSGSLDALQVLYERHAELIFRTALRFSASRQDAEDVVQDLFVGLRDALTRYQEQGRFDAWARRIAVRLALARRRAAHRQEREDYPAALTTARASVGDPLDSLAVRDAIESLPDQLRDVFLLREVEGFTHEEIGAALTISAGASMVRLSRAKTILRSLLK